MNTHNDKNADDQDRSEELELTPDEKKALEQLPRQRVPNEGLEDRVVSTLRRRGLLRSPQRRVIQLTGWRIAAVAAACVVVLLAGFVLGQWTGSGQSATNDQLPAEGNDFSVAASLQQAGSAYLLSLDRLASLPNSADSQEAAQGREIALSTLCAATDQVARLMPRDTLVERLLTTLASNSDIWAAGPPSEITIEGYRVIEF